MSGGILKQNASPSSLERRMCTGVVNLLYFWLISPDFAKQRVAKRVSKGGHNIPADVIERRYYRGIFNLLNLYIPIVDNWMVIDNMDVTPGIIGKGSANAGEMIINPDLWDVIQDQGKSHGK